MHENIKFKYSNYITKLNDFSQNSCRSDYEKILTIFIDDITCLEGKEIKSITDEDRYKEIHHDI